MVEKYNEVAVVNTESIVGEEITETLGLVSSICLTWFIFNKEHSTNLAIDKALSKLQFQAFRDGADAVVNLRTTVEMQGQFIFTRINVFAQGTMVSLKR